MLRFNIPIRLVSLANVRMHWAFKAKKAKEQRFTGHEFCKWALMEDGGKPWWNPPWKIKITRIGKRKMDSDNLAISAKHVRDGIADALGVNDGDESKVLWFYEQKIGKEYSVEIEIS